MSMISTVEKVQAFKGPNGKIFEHWKDCVEANIEACLEIKGEGYHHQYHGLLPLLTKMEPERRRELAKWLLEL